MKGFNIIEDLTDYQKSFVNTIITKSRKYLGWKIRDIENHLEINYDNRDNIKQYVRLIFNHALGITKGNLLYDQYKKSGISVKTIPLKSNNMIKEDMSFPNFNYMNVINEEWETSDFKKEINIFLLLIHKRPNAKAKKEESIFEQILLHIPNKNDLEIMKSDWENIIKMIEDGNADKLKRSIGTIVHTRPKDEKSIKKYDAPGGLKCVKKCFWINKDYFQKVLLNHQNNPDFYDPMIAIDTFETPQNKRVNSKILRVIRDTKITTELKQLHDYKCQICGHRIPIYEGKKIRYYCEAHHLKPLAQVHNGPDIKENIIILCPNHHIEFDYGVIAINPSDSQTIIHKQEENQYHGRKIETKHQIAKEFIQYHYDMFMGNISRKNGLIDDYIKSK